MRTDEDTDTEDSERFIKHIPEWRSEKLNELIKKLDERCTHSREKGGSKPTKARKLGLPLKRPVPASTGP